MASCHPQPRTATSVRPVYSCHRRFQNSPVPSGKLYHASVGIVSVLLRSRPSDCLISLYPRLRAVSERSLLIPISATCPPPPLTWSSPPLQLRSSAQHTQN